MTAFSVAVTEASSRNIFFPLRARALMRYSYAETSICAPRFSRAQQVSVDAPAADDVARPVW